MAYALAGTVDIDLKNDEIGKDANGNAVYFNDIWPSAKEIEDVVQSVVTSELFKKEYAQVFNSNERWNEIKLQTKLYILGIMIQHTFKTHHSLKVYLKSREVETLSGLRVVGKFGDSVTTDHISPAGSIGKHTPAGRYLLENGVQPVDFNSYGSRRGNHEVMMRGTFANIRIKTKSHQGTEGGYTTYWPTGEVTSIYDAAMKYKEDGTGLLVVAGKDYGMGSSRDWAAKGTNLLGIKAVIAESFERIHRSNLVLMGVLPLQFKDGESAETLGLVGNESFEIQIDKTVRPRDLCKSSCN